MALSTRDIPYYRVHIDIEKLLKREGDIANLKKLSFYLGSLLNNKPGIFQKLPITHVIIISNLAYPGSKHKFEISLSHTITGHESSSQPGDVTYDVDSLYLSRGHFSRVTASTVAFHIKPNKRVKFVDGVRRVIKEQIVRDDNSLEHHIKEGEILLRIPHAHSKKIVISSDQTTTRIISRLFSGGPLSISATKKWNNLDKLFRFLAFIRAYNYQVSNLDLVHKDIKFPNVVFDKISGTFKIIDYAFAIQKGTTKSPLCGTLEFTAPEIFLERPELISEKTDINSIGVMFSIVFDELPRPDSYLEAKNAALNPVLPNLLTKTKYSPGAEKKLRELLTQMVAVNIEARPNGSQVERILEDILLGIASEMGITNTDLDFNLSVLFEIKMQLNNAKKMIIIDGSFGQIETAIQLLNQLKGTPEQQYVIAKTILPYEVLNCATNIQEIQLNLSRPIQALKSNLESLLQLRENANSLLMYFAQSANSVIDLRKPITDLQFLISRLEHTITKTNWLPLDIDPIAERTKRIENTLLENYELELEKIRNDRYVKFFGLVQNQSEPCDEITLFKKRIIDLITPEFKQRTPINYFLSQNLRTPKINAKTILHEIVNILLNETQPISLFERIKKVIDSGGVHANETITSISNYVNKRLASLDPNFVRDIGLSLKI